MNDNRRPATHNRFRRWAFFAFGALLIGAAAMVAGVIAVGLYLSSPARTAVGAPPAEFKAEPVTIASRSGAKLAGWFIAGQPGAGAVVLMHGVRANRLSMLGRARLLTAEGFSVLLFDFQAHGESEGSRITFGFRESLDAASAVAWLRTRLPDERVGAIGTSLGGAAALLANPLDVDALAIEAVYPDIRSAVANRVRAVLGVTIGDPIALPVARLFELVLPPIIGIRPENLRPIDGVARVKGPLLLACGTRDNRTTIAETRAMFALAREPKTLWEVEGAGHVDLEAFAPDEYRRHVLPFLVQHLQRPS